MQRSFTLALFASALISGCALAHQIDDESEVVTPAPMHAGLCAEHPHLSVSVERASPRACSELDTLAYLQLKRAEESELDDGTPRTTFQLAAVHSSCGNSEASCSCYVHVDGAKLYDYPGKPVDPGVSDIDTRGWYTAFVRNGVFTLSRRYEVQPNIQRLELVFSAGDASIADTRSHLEDFSLRRGATTCEESPGIDAPQGLQRIHHGLVFEQVGQAIGSDTESDTAPIVHTTSASVGTLVHDEVNEGEIGVFNVGFDASYVMQTFSASSLECVDDATADCAPPPASKVSFAIYRRAIEG